MQEAAAAGVARPESLAVGVVQGFQVPATIGREAGDRIHPVGYQGPEIFRTAHATREAAAHPHDRDRVV